jgi:phage host-nuclease inhibitor protein Gam
MTQKRIKQTVAAEIGSRAEAEAVAAEIATLELRRRSLQNSMDAEIERVKGSYAHGINGASEELEALMARLTDWANQNRGEFRERRSIETPSATFGFRVGMPKVGKLRGWTWERVLEAVRCQAGPFKHWIREKLELDKTAILADRKVGEKIESLGIIIDQDETFYVEPKLSEPATAMKQEAA